MTDKSAEGYICLCGECEDCIEAEENPKCGRCGGNISTTVMHGQKKVGNQVIDLETEYKCMKCGYALYGWVNIIG